MASVVELKSCFPPFKMEPWEDWKLSSETENRLKIILSKLDDDKSLEESNPWLDLLNYGSPVIPNSSFGQMEVDLNDDPNEEILNLITESLETDSILPEEKLTGISYNSLNTILALVRESLNELNFSTFCKFIINWKNRVLVEDSLRVVVLPKLQEKSEATACMIFSIKELVINKPDEMTHQVLAPLLLDETEIFSDIELLNEVLPCLKLEQKEYLIITMTNKKKFQENDWLVLQALLKDSSPSSTSAIVNCIIKFSNVFTKSQVFGRFLVSFCKNLQHIKNKDLLKEAINQHQTLLKRQALKYLESVEEN